MGFIFQSYASSTWAVPVNSKVWTENIFFFIIFFFFFFFFSFFFKIWIFRVIRWVKGQKNDPKRQKIITVALYISETYIIWFWFLLHMCRMMISAAFFFFLHFFKILIFLVFRGAKGQKRPKLPISVCHALYLRNCISYHWDFWFTGVK